MKFEKHALNNVEHHGCVQERRQQEAPALNGVAGSLDSGALELIGVIGLGVLDVPVLADTGFALDSAVGLASVEALELAL